MHCKVEIYPNRVLDNDKFREYLDSLDHSMNTFFKSHFAIASGKFEVPGWGAKIFVYRSRWDLHPYSGPHYYSALTKEELHDKIDPFIKKMKNFKTQTYWV